LPRLATAPTPRIRSYPPTAGFRIHSFSKLLRAPLIIAHVPTTAAADTAADVVVAVAQMTSNAVILQTGLL
jgi:hypothetical protein